MAREKESRLALVTGAAQGIGRAIAQRFVLEGLAVIALDRMEDALQEVVAEGGGQVLPCAFDLEEIAAIPELVGRLTDAHGPVTVLVNNAGAWHYEPLVGIPDERWEHIFRVNVTAPFVLMREIAPMMIAQGEGSIVNIASRNAMVSSEGSAAYDASKAALVALTRTAAGEFAGHNIQVNAVCPGVINTTANDDLFEDEEARENYLRLIPARRYGESEEIAGIVHFLTTPDAGFITGQTIVADGGQMAFMNWKRLFEDLEGEGNG